MRIKGILDRATSGWHSSRFISHNLYQRRYVSTSRIHFLSKDSSDSKKPSSDTEKGNSSEEDLQELKKVAEETRQRVQRNLSFLRDVFVENSGPAQKNLQSNVSFFSEVVSKNIIKDDTTWNDALRGVFGIKPLDKIRKQEEIIRERKEAMKAAAAEQNASEENNQEPVDHETKPVEPSFLEVKLEELGKKISSLESEREQVDPSSETPDLQEFKRINKEIKAVRKEMQELTAALNTDALVFKEQDQGTWDKFAQGFKHAPLLGDILGFGKRISESDTVKSAKNVAEDARNVFETSQNPVVYRLYNIYEGIFKENEHAEAVKEFKRIDPNFSLDDMNQEIEDDIIPQIVTAYLRGDADVIEELCESDALNGIKASIQMRKESQRKMDPSILSIDHITLLTMKNVDKVGPIGVIQFMVQQIDCLYDLKGNVVEGKDDKIVAVFYVMALTRRYFEEELRHRFVCKEFAVVGTQPYL